MIDQPSEADKRARRRYFAQMETGLSALGEVEQLENQVRSLRDRRSLLLSAAWPRDDRIPAAEDLRAAADEYQRAARHASAAAEHLRQLAQLADEAAADERQEEQP